MRTRLIIGVVVVIFIIILGVAFVNIATNNFHLPFFGARPSSTVSIDGHTFYVTLVKTEKDQEIGLSHRSSLPQDQGMLFPFDHPDYYAFWMRDMKFPIDIIYIANKHIVSIYANVPKPTTTDTATLPIYKPNQPADTVLEINAGLANTYHFSVGDTVTTSL